MRTTGRIFAALLLTTATAASADPWNDESGNGRDRYDEHRGDHRGDGHHAGGHHGGHWGYAIPRGHRPSPGMCRVWFDGRPAGHQPPPTSCARALWLAEEYGGGVIWGRRR